MLINGTEMVLFGNAQAPADASANLHKRRELSSGAVSMTYLSLKEYGIRFGLKGQALKRAHERYRVDRGTSANANLAGLIAKGLVVLEKVTVAKDKSSFTGKFMASSAFDITDPRKEAEKVASTDLVSILKDRASSDGQLLELLRGITDPAQAPGAPASQPTQ
jgi:hypothetical protein